MSQVHEAVCASRRARRLAGVCTVAVLSVALVAPLASAETLSDLRNQVADTRTKRNTAQDSVHSAQQNVNAATQALLTSQNELENAQAALADISVELDIARENDARIAAELEAARAELELAKQRVAKAEAEVAAQVALIGQAARESFQQQSDLRDLTVLFGAETPAEMSQRLQWNTTVFDTQAAEKARLDAVRDELEAARALQAEIEARIAGEKAESEKSVARIAQLERQAEAQRAMVARLVAANEVARTAAQSELDADEAAFRSLQADEQRLQGEIQAEIARIRAEEEARRKAEEEARDTQKPSSAQPPRASTPSRSSSRVSAHGFQRPVNANYGSPFGMRFHPILKYWRMHNGVDLGAPTGTPIYASQSGTVLKSGPNGGYGNFILIGHGDAINGKYVTTGYAHNSRNVVSVGQRVERGQLIGYVGSTGLSTTPHLHFELRLDGVPVNAVRYVA